MTQDAQTPRLTFTVDEAAACLGMGRHSVHALLKSGRLRSIRVGRKIVIPRDAVAELLRG